MSQKAESLEDVQYESNIVWLEDINNIPYVREHLETYASRRKGSLKYQGHKIIGYSELEDKSPNNGSPGTFTRRVWWLSQYDRYLDPSGAYKDGCPMEAVEPLTVAPKTLGRKTQRAWGGPLPEDVY